MFPLTYLKLLRASHFCFILLYNYKVLSCRKVYYVFLAVLFFLENSTLAVKNLHFFFSKTLNLNVKQRVYSGLLYSLSLTQKNDFGCRKGNLNKQENPSFFEILMFMNQNLFFLYSFSIINNF